MLGAAGETNVQGEEQQKLDVIANEMMKQALDFSGRPWRLHVTIGTPLLFAYDYAYDPLNGISEAMMDYIMANLVDPNGEALDFGTTRAGSVPTAATT